ncbi:MAG: DNA primase small subunit domain-containing protein [Deltaproteobacteria bacterium]
MAQEEPAEVLELAGREVRITHPSKPYFSRQLRLTKLELVRYFLSVADGALAGISARPIVLKRFVNGAEAEPFYQKRAPEKRPSWLRTVTLRFPSGRTAEEIVVDDAAGLIWVVNLGCIELHPHPVRATDLEHPDELRVDLDPGPGVDFADVRRVALEVRGLLGELGLVGFAKTSGSRGLHVNVPIQQRWGFGDVRRAALALSREVERRAPSLATSKWWKEERHGVFLDYNQNAKDRTTASAFSVRPLPDARVSTPLAWDEVPDCDPRDFTVLTVPRRFAERPDPWAGLEGGAGSLEPLLELAARDDAQGLGDAPWPPHFGKMPGEAPRVAPSRARRKAPVAKIAAGEAEAGTAPGQEAEVGAIQPPPRRRSRMPLLVIAHSPDKAAALAGLERWQAKNPEVAALLAPDDVLVDSMRGRSSTWTRVRVNLRHVPAEQRPAQQTPDPDDDPTRVWRERWRKHRAPPDGG